MTKKFLLSAPLVLAFGTLIAVPASAASVSNPGQIRAEIQQLDRQIDRTRNLSRREEQRLQGQVDRLQGLYQSFARGGFSRGELQRLDREVSAVKAQVHRHSPDRNGFNSRNDRRDHDDRRDRGNDHRR